MRLGCFDETYVLDFLYYIQHILLLPYSVVQERMIFTTRRCASMLWPASVCLSVCLSVHPVQVGVLTK